MPSSPKKSPGTFKALFHIVTLALPLWFLTFCELQALNQRNDSHVSVALSEFSAPPEIHALPPLDTILDKHGNITGSPQALLDYATIGFGKCGTTTLMDWLGDHPELQSLKSEVYAFMSKEPEKLIERLHRKLTLNRKRGYKCPGDIREQHIIEYYRTLFPKTKLFIGIRHPISMFQSLYNFRVQNFEDFHDMLHPNQLIGGCFRSSKMCCTTKADFAFDLMKLGKQNYNGSRPTTALEEEILNGRGHGVPFDPTVIPFLPNDVFLFDLRQLGDKNATRKTILRKDIQSYLDLKQELPEVIHRVPGRKWDDEIQNEKNRLKMDICEDQYIPLRVELLRIGRLSSEWIRTVFLDLPGVHVSSREFVEKILLDYAKDPCGNKTSLMTAAQVQEIFEETKQKYFKEIS